MGLKKLEANLEICIAKQILDAMIRCAHIGFLSYLGIQYIIGIFFNFFVTLRPERLVCSAFLPAN